MIRVIDLETTGETPHEEIVEVGWSDIEGNSYLGFKIALQDDDFTGKIPYASSLVDPGCPISALSSSIHHLTNEHVRGAPKAEEVLRRVFDCTSDTIFVAHHAEHEIGVLGQRGHKWIDTWKVAIHLGPSLKRFSLQFLRYALDLDVDDTYALPAHRAGPDAYVTAALMLRMLDKLSPEQMIEISSGPVFLPRLMFGKHAEDPVDEVPNSYFEWILNQRDPADGTYSFNEHVVYTAQTILAERSKNPRG